MTRQLLLALEGLRGKALAQVGFALLVLGLLPLALVWDGLTRFRLRLRMLQALHQDSARCSQGHTVELLGTFTCPSCGLTEQGHAFEPCIHCGHVSYTVLCPCGGPVVNPLHEAAR